MNRKTGFTLVELLVVISIIAMLLAVLIPSLNKARAAGQAVVCSSNQKQIALASIMYCDTNSGLFPRPYYVSGQSYLFLTQMLAPYIGGANKTEKDANGEIRYFYNLYQCPASKFKNTIWHHSSYGINWMIGGEWTVKSGGTLPKRSEVFRPSEVVLYVDYAPESSSAAYAFNFFMDQTDMKAVDRAKNSFRHSGKVVVAYTDGRCARFKLSEIDAPDRVTYSSLKVKRPWNPWAPGVKNGRPVF